MKQYIQNNFEFPLRITTKINGKKYNVSCQRFYQVEKM